MIQNIECVISQSRDFEVKRHLIENRHITNSGSPGKKAPCSEILCQEALGFLRKLTSRRAKFIIFLQILAINKTCEKSKFL